MAALLLGLPGAANAQEVDLSGRWVMLLRTVTTSEVAVLGEVRATTEAVVIYDLEQEGDVLRGSGQICGLSVDSGTRMVRTLLPPAFVKAQPTPRLDARIVERGGQLRLEQRRTWTVLGAQLRAPRTEPLPTQASDARVLDQDQDGKPGVTVRVDGLVEGEVYVAQRSWSDWVGEVRSPSLIQGRVRFDQEQVVLGATSELLKEPPLATPDLRRSSLVLQRLEPGATCAQARQKAKPRR